MVAKYGAYHHNTVNIGIHMACVPIILFSGFCLVSGRQEESSSYLPPCFRLTHSLRPQTQGHSFLSLAGSLFLT